MSHHSSTAEQAMRCLFTRADTADTVLEFLKLYATGGNHYSLLHHFIQPENRGHLLTIVTLLHSDKQIETEMYTASACQDGCGAVARGGDADPREKTRGRAGAHPGTYTHRRLNAEDSAEKVYDNITRSNPGAEGTFIRYLLREEVNKAMTHVAAEGCDPQLYQELSSAVVGVCQMVFVKKLVEYLNTGQHSTVKNIIPVSLHICISCILERLVLGGRGNGLTRNNTAIYTLPDRLYDIVKQSKALEYTTTMSPHVTNKLQNSMCNMCIGWLSSQHTELDHNTVVDLGQESYNHYTHFVRQ